MSNPVINSLSSLSNMSRAELDLVAQAAADLIPTIFCMVHHPIPIHHL